LLAPREYSKRLGTLTHAQLQAALDRFALGELVAAEPASGGLFGQNVLLETERGAFVLRGAPHSNWQLPKERFFARLLHERTRAPVPWPYRIEDASDIFGWSFALLPRLPGECPSLPKARESLSSEDRREIAAALGEQLAELHALVWPAPGEYELARDDVCAADAPFADWTLARLRDWLARSREASDATTDEDVDWVESILAPSRAALAQPFEPGFVHADYTEGNVVVERAAKGFRVTGVFDLMTAYMGDPEEDLVRSFSHYARGDSERARRFIAAYRAKRALRPGCTERFPVYMLTDRLVFWEYGQRNHIWFPAGMSLREFAEPFLRLGAQLA
jgi:hygromycin-B 7''-O-kinase